MSVYRRSSSKAEAVDDYTASRTTASTGSPRSRRLWILAAMAAGALVVGAVLTMRSTSDRLAAAQSTTPAPPSAFRAGPCEAPKPRPANPTAEDRERWSRSADEAEAMVRETGFGQYSAPAQDGSWVCGWIKVGPPPIDAAEAAAHQGADIVYDAPNGNVMGVAYMSLGYFPKSEVERAGFDPRSLRLERYGCDPVASTDCQPRTTILGNR